MTLATVLQGMGIGTNPNIQLILNQPKDRIRIDEKGWTVVTTYLTLYAGWTGTANGMYSVNQVYNGVVLRSIDCVQLEDFGELCFVTLTFDQYYGVPTTPLPQPQYGTNGECVELDIQKHPYFVIAPPSDQGPGPWSQWWNPATKAFDPAYLPPGGGPTTPMPAFLSGFTKYFASAATIWTKVYYDSQPDAPLPDGTIQDPGFGFGPSGCYLATTCDQQKENAFWYRLTHYKYSVLPWPTQVYTAPNAVVPPGTLNKDGSISS